MTLTKFLFLAVPVLFGSETIAFAKHQVNLTSSPSSECYRPDAQAELTVARAVMAKYGSKKMDLDPRSTPVGSHTEKSAEADSNRSDQHNKALLAALGGGRLISAAESLQCNDGPGSCTLKANQPLLRLSKPKTSESEVVIEATVWSPTTDKKFPVQIKTFKYTLEKYKSEWRVKSETVVYIS